MSWMDVNECLVLLQPLQSEDVARILLLLETFVADNEDSTRRSNIHAHQDTDPLDGLVSLLRNPGVNEHQRLTLAALKALKILSRKRSNRLAMINKDEALRIGLQLIQAPSDVDYRVAAEAANVILNACYEQENVNVVLECQGAAALVALLSAAAEDLQASAAGALASVCFYSAGRAAVRDAGGIPPLIVLLASTSLQVRTRAVGAIHNLSSDASSLHLIRRNNGIRPLIRLLRSPQTSEIKRGAAGALQNLSRGVASLPIILDGGAVRALTNLLLNGEEPQTKMAAAGALRNISSSRSLQED